MGDSAGSPSSRGPGDFTPNTLRVGLAEGSLAPTPESTPSFPAGTGIGNGVSFDATGKRSFTAYISATSVTSGATIQIQAQNSVGTWFPIHEEVITTNGMKDPIVWEGVFYAIRAAITAYTDGTYVVTIDAA